MGYSLSWIAVPSTTATELRTRLGLAETASKGNFYDFQITGMTLRTHWYLLTAKGCEHPIVYDRVLSELSAENSVVACSISETVMHVAAGFWQRGRKVWSVLHRGGDHGIMDLVVDGSPPPVFETLSSRHFALQAAGGGSDADVDHIFEIPLELARSIVGFKHDSHSSEIDDTDFRALRLESNGLLDQVTPPKWKFWLRIIDVGMTAWMRQR